MSVLAWSVPKEPDHLTYVASADQRDDAAWPVDHARVNGVYIPATKMQRSRPFEYVTHVTTPPHVTECVMNDWRAYDVDVALNNSVPPFVPMLCPYLPQENFSDTVSKVRGRVADNTAAVRAVVQDLGMRTEPFVRAKLESIFYKDPHFAADVLCTMRDDASTRKRAREADASSNARRVRAQVEIGGCVIYISESGVMYPPPHTHV